MFLTLVLPHPEEIVPVGHEQTDLLVDEFFQEIQCVLVVFIDIDRDQSVFIALVVLLFRVEKTYVQLLCLFNSYVLILATATIFHASAMISSRYASMETTFTETVSGNETRSGSCRRS